jgi:hypothetical protein
MWSFIKFFIKKLFVKEKLTNKIPAITNFKVTKFLRYLV